MTDQRMTDQRMTDLGVADQPVADLNIVVSCQIEDDCVASITAVSPRLHVQVGAPAAHLPKARQRNILFPPADINDLLGDADVLFTFKIPDGLLARAPRLRWIQFTSAGVDQAAGLGLESTDIILTTTSGIHAHTMSEYVLATMLMFTHRFPRALRQQMAHQWKRYAAGDLAGKTVGIVGYGHIGQAVARPALAFGMEVFATRRSVTAPREVAVEGGTVHLLPASQLHQLLERSDFVVMAVPLIRETVRLIGEAELGAMKRTAYLVNISRGSVIDEPALLRALQEGRIAGAALDVFETEPLPGDSPFWDMENVILTPHSAGSNENYNSRATAIFRDNLARYLAGQPLINVVDKQRGY
jgi:phosphoglycerate dehydrogenase-like enzyme